MLARGLTRAQSLSAIHSLFLAMAVNPEVQVKAQQEIDRVIGNDRLPGFEDRDHLPYINAICSELLRWLPAAPLGVPRLLLDDDHYNGFHFPKNSIFLVNAWYATSVMHRFVFSFQCRGLLHDPERYPNPSKFDPERYTKAHPEQDPRTIAFGYGRRWASSSIRI